jgi:uncharacterized protein (TIGR00369 family)
MSENEAELDERLLDVPPLARLLGRTVMTADRTGAVHLRFTPGPELCNRYGTIQGGILGAMLDAALGMSVLVTLPHNTSPVTVSMTAQYFVSATPGCIEAHARVLQSSKTLAHAEADLYTIEGTRLAHAIATLRILQK